MIATEQSKGLIYAIRNAYFAFRSFVFYFLERVDLGSIRNSSLDAEQNKRVRSETSEAFRCLTNISEVKVCKSFYNS
jgi:hypothetical protein